MSRNKKTPRFSVQDDSENENTSKVAKPSLRNVKCCEMVQSWHTDLVKHEHLIRLSPQNSNSYVMTVTEATILQEIRLRK